MNPSTPIQARPRKVPLATQIVVQFGHTLQRVGWIFFAFGSAFAWVFAGNADISSLWQFRGELKTTQGIITSVRQTHFSEGGSKHSKGTPVYEYSYEFTVDDRPYHSIAFRTGSIGSAGGSVAVQYRAGHPEISRITGMRKAPFGPVVLMVLMFPLIGLAMIMYFASSGRRNVWLLENGEVTQGTLIRKEATNTQVNKQPVYKLTFAFKDLYGQTQEAVAKTHLPEKLMDERTETLFYDPRNPRHAVMLDGLPGDPEITSRGEIGTCQRRVVVLTLTLMFVAFLSLVLGVYFKLQR